MCRDVVLEQAMADDLRGVGFRCGRARQPHPPLEPRMSRRRGEASASWCRRGNTRRTGPGPQKSSLLAKSGPTLLFREAEAGLDSRGDHSLSYRTMVRLAARSGGRLVHLRITKEVICRPRPSPPIARNNHSLAPATRAASGSRSNMRWRYSGSVHGASGLWGRHISPLGGGD
jgi:hypothetical protein